MAKTSTPPAPVKTSPPPAPVVQPAVLAAAVGSVVKYNHADGSGPADAVVVIVHNATCVDLRVLSEGVMVRENICQGTSRGTWRFPGA